MDAPRISNHSPVPYHVQSQHVFGIVLFLNLESEGAGVAGELTACKSQCVRLPERSRVEATALESVSLTRLNPPIRPCAAAG